MKKTGFKRKPRKPLKRTRLRKKSKYNLAKRKDVLWELCKQITRARYKAPDGSWACYTSGKRLTIPSDVQTGHGKPKGALPLRFKYDLRNLRIQCYHCNINLGGCSDIFIAKLETEPEGLAFLQESCRFIPGEGWRIKQEGTMGGTEARIFVEKLIEEYTKILSELSPVLN